MDAALVISISVLERSYQLLSFIPFPPYILMYKEMSLLRIVNQEKLFGNNFLVSRFLITFAFTFLMRG